MSKRFLFPPRASWRRKIAENPGGGNSALGRSSFHALTVKQRPRNARPGGTQLTGGAWLGRPWLGRPWLERPWLGDRGATTLEFSLVAFPFVIMILAIFEIGIIFFEQSTLSEAVARVGRLIRTGQAINSYGTLSASDQVSSIIAQICSTAMMPNCASRLTVQIENPGSFATYTPGSALQGTPPNQTLATSAVNFGAACTIQVVHAYYPWQLLVPINRWWLGNPSMGGTSFLLSAAMVFENEPFATDLCSPSP